MNVLLLLKDLHTKKTINITGGQGENENIRPMAK